MAHSHPYLKGNYSPVKRELPLTACTIVEGSVPNEYAGGQYVRNGGNPLADEDDNRNAHWFDGDGMLTGVLFKRGNKSDDFIQPHFINRYILTDVLLSTSSTLKRPLLPSITTFALPLGFFRFILLLLDLGRAVILVLLSWLPFQKTPGISRISVANTSIWWHDGQAFAGCDSGPPIRILLPGLETAGWWTGQDATGKGDWAKGIGPIKMINEFTTAHTRVDPITNELLLYHMSFIAPFLRISVIPPRSSNKSPLLAAPVYGMKQSKLAHDFCATSKHTILIDLPLILDPRNLSKGKAMLEYKSNQNTRFAIIPRWEPDKVTWYESKGCCIYHAANAWDTEDDSTTSLLACRLNSATLVYSAGNIDTPIHARSKEGIEKCQLYYWQFSRKNNQQQQGNGVVKCEFPLSDIPFEFPTMNQAYSQRLNQYIYGASMTSGTFDAGLGTRSAKIDCLVKMNVTALIKKGKENSNQNQNEAVDKRTVGEILKDNNNNDSIQIFSLPPNQYAQEATFVPRQDAKSEDDGFLTFFVFNEESGLDSHGDCIANATSQLWIIDAKNMKNVICKIQLPSRVPYGLHGAFFSEDDIQSQLPVRPEDVRSWALSVKCNSDSKSNISNDANATILHQHLSSVIYFIRSSIEQCL